MLLYHQIYRYGAPRVRKERSGDSSFRVKRLLSEWGVKSGGERMNDRMDTLDDIERLQR